MNQATISKARENADVITCKTCDILQHARAGRKRTNGFLLYTIFTGSCTCATQCSAADKQREAKKATATTSHIVADTTCHV